jgi:hypothetical protein
MNQVEYLSSQRMHNKNKVESTLAEIKANKYEAVPSPEKEIPGNLRSNSGKVAYVLQSSAEPGDYLGEYLGLIRLKLEGKTPTFSVDTRLHGNALRYVSYSPKDSNCELRNHWVKQSFLHQPTLTGLLS